MIFVLYEIDVLAEKQKEFTQAVPMILEKTCEQSGCLRHHLCRDTADENRFFVIQTWKDQPALNVHWRSDRFSTFLGTFHLLKRSPTVQIHAVSFTAGMEAIEAVRAKLSDPNIKQEESKQNS
jgi:quinol monooxygenase YgiN